MICLKPDIFKAFYAARNDANAGPMAAYMKNKFPFLGIKTPERKLLCSAFLKEMKKDRSIDWPFIWTCYDLPEREFQYLALTYLETVKKLLVPEDIPALEKLVTTKSWWDTVDTIDAFVGDLCLRHPSVKETDIPRWIASDNIWLKRIAIDFQLQYREKTDTAVLSCAILSNTGSKEFFVNKAIGWALREYSKTDKAWVRRFVDENKNTLSALSVKEASKYI
ncbi:DNA alkylation repair protein [Oscillospiraceae bacterium CM]|nr:DNA alkylation repair protein [Oscillospiraceae bacterium CM]